MENHAVGFGSSAVALRTLPARLQLQPVASGATVGPAGASAQLLPRLHAGAVKLSSSCTVEAVAGTLVGLAVARRFARRRGARQAARAAPTARADMRTSSILDLSRALSSPVGAFGQLGSMLTDFGLRIPGSPVIAPRMPSFTQVHTSVAVVDCGSGSTRATHFVQDRAFGGGHLPKVRHEKSSWRGEALALALQDEARLQKLIDLLDENLPGCPVLVGATAGVRAALEDGTVARPQLDSFASRLDERFGGRARFQVLSGEEEGQAEWRAVLHELRRRPGAVDPPPADCAGMLSGGGMSCQLVLGSPSPGSASAQAFSFQNRVLLPDGLPDRAARGSLTPALLLDGLAQFEAYAAEVAATLPRSLRGSFALVEWVALLVAGEETPRDRSMGLGYERTLTRQQVISALDSHLASLRLEALRGGPASSVERPVAVALVYGTILRTVFEQVFHEDARFYALRGVSWAMGHYLLSCGQTPAAFP